MATSSEDLAHVYLVDCGLDLGHEELQFMAYDDATQQLLVVKGNHVFAYDVTAGGSLKWMYPLQEGPAVTALRPSLDNRLLVVQRSAVMLELVDLARGNCFVHCIHKGRGAILGFFWADCPEVDLVVVTTRAVELTQLAARRQGLRCKERLRHHLLWATYSHETRMLLAGLGGDGTAACPTTPATQLGAWQFSSQGVVTLPPFQLHGPLPAAAAVRQYIPTADTAPVAAAAPAVVAGGLAGMAGGGGGSSGMVHQVLQRNVWLLKLYQRVYLAHVSPLSQQLELYRFYTDTLILQHMYDLVMPRVQLSVVDNTLLVHYPEASVALLLDVALPARRPLVEPLPLRRLQLLPAAALTSGANTPADRPTTPTPLGQQQGPGGAAAAGVGGLPRAASGVLQLERAASGQTGLVYVSSECHHNPTFWQFHTPNIIVDSAAGTVGQLALDLRGVTESAGDWAGVVGFLMRRKASLSPAPLVAEPGELLLGVCRGALQDKPGVGVLRAMFRHLLEAYADELARTAARDRSNGGAPQPTAGSATTTPGSAPATAAALAAGAGAGAGGGSGSGGAGLRGPLLSVPAVTVLAPAQVAAGVFKWAADEEVVDALYLQAAVSEFRAVAEACGIAPPLYLQLLPVDLLLQQEQHYQAVQLLYSQPSSSTMMLAEHLGAGMDPEAGGGVGVGPGAAAAAVAAAADKFRGAREALSGGLPRTTSESGLAAARGAAQEPTPTAAVAMQLAVDVLARQAAAERGVVVDAAVADARGQRAGAAGIVRPMGGAAGLAAGAAGWQGRTGPKPCTEAYIQQLLATGQVLRAAKVARAAGLLSTAVTAGAARGGAAAGGGEGYELPWLLLQAAVDAGEPGVFAGVYRQCLPVVSSRYATLQQAWQQLGGGGMEGAAGGAPGILAGA